MLTDSDHNDAPAPPLSIMTTYFSSGDSIDKTIEQRYMHCGAKSSTIHYFHSYPVVDRISFKTEKAITRPGCAIGTIANQENLLETTTGTRGAASYERDRYK